jgi:hypothetical protein
MSNPCKYTLSTCAPASRATVAARSASEALFPLSRGLPFKINTLFATISSSPACPAQIRQNHPLFCQRRWILQAMNINGPAPNTIPITVINKLIASAGNMFTNYRANQGIRQYKIVL